MKSFCAAPLFPKLLLAATLVVGGPRVGWGQQQRPQVVFTPPGSYDEHTRNPTLRYEPGGRAGTYRGPDGSWRPVQIAGWLPDRVYLNESGNFYRAFSPGEILAFVHLTDTVVTVAGVAPGKLGHQTAAFGLQQFRGAGLQLVDVTNETHSLLDMLFASHKLFIRQQNDGWILVPKQKAALQQLLLTLLADDPALVAELRAKRVGRGQLPRLLARYADFRTTQFLQSASRPRS